MAFSGSDNATVYNAMAQKVSAPFTCIFNNIVSVVGGEKTIYFRSSIMPRAIELYSLLQGNEVFIHSFITYICAYVDPQSLGNVAWFEKYLNFLLIHKEFDGG